VGPGHDGDFDGFVDCIRAVTAEETDAIAETVAEQLLAEETVIRHDTVESRLFLVATVDGESVG
jgi:hypothetical protein